MLLVVVVVMLLQELPQRAVGYEALLEETEKHMAELREKEDALVSSSSSMIG
jgi:hypothetical protein